MKSVLECDEKNVVRVGDKPIVYYLSYIEHNCGEKAILLARGKNVSKASYLATVCEKELGFVIRDTKISMEIVGSDDLVTIRIVLERDGNEEQKIRDYRFI